MRTPDQRPNLRRNVLVMAITAGLNVGAMMMWAPILSLILRDLGAGDVVIGAANAVWLVLSASCQYFGGILADRLGRVPVIAWPGVLSGVSIAACALAPSWPLFVVLYAFYHAGGAIQGPVFSSIIGESVPQAERGRAFSRVEVAIGVGVITGPLTGSVLLPILGTQAVLALSGVLFLVAAVGRLIWLRETKPESTASVSFRATDVLRPPLLRVLGVSVGVNSLLSLTLWGPFLSLHASDVMGLSKSAINQLAAVGSGVGILVALIAGHFVSRRGPAPVLRLAMPALSLAAMLWSMQRAPVAIVLAYILMYAAFEFAMISSDTYRVQHVPDEVRGRALGTIGMTNGIVTAPVVPLASMLRVAVGSAAPFFMSVVPVVLGLFALSAGAEGKRGRREPAEVVAAGK